MARKKTTKSTIAKEEIVQIPKITKEKVAPKPIITTIDCVLNSSYIIDNFDVTKYAAIAHLNTKPIDGDIININGKYNGIKLIPKNEKLIIYTGKHSLSQKEDVTSGTLTVQLMEI